MAQVMTAVQRPAILLTPNKTWAAPLYGEMRAFFLEFEAVAQVRDAIQRLRAGW